MSKSYLTILVLASDTSKTKQLKISTGRYKLLRNVLIGVALLFAFVCFDYVNMRVQHLALSNLKKENITQKIELNEFTKKIGDVEAQLARLQVFDKKLRILANIETPAEEASMGMGGNALEAGTFLSPADKREELVTKMRSDLTVLESETALREKSFVELKSHLSEQSSLLASTPSVWPARGWVSSGFGKRKSPFTGLMQKHAGLDIANRVGTPIIASADGIVVYVGRKQALGKVVIINHGYGIKTVYGHLSKALVKKGQKVKRGVKVAEMGNTGRSTGPHLHYDVVVNGVSVNPKTYILN